MLALDYALRFIENLLYTWPPPIYVIDYFSSKLPNTAISLSTRGDSPHKSNQVMSSERYNKEPNIEYSDIENPNTTASVHSTYGSKVTIMT